MTSSRIILQNSSRKAMHFQWEPECVQIVLNKGESLTIENPHGSSVCELRFFDDPELTSIVAIYPDNPDVIFRRTESEGAIQT